MARFNNFENSGSVNFQKNETKTGFFSSEFGNQQQIPSFSNQIKTVPPYLNNMNPSSIPNPNINNM